MTIRTVEALAPAHALRSLRCGDSWIYSATGSLTSPGAGPLSLDGIISVSVVADALSGIAGALTLMFSQAFAVTRPDSSRETLPGPDWMFSFVQDPVTQDLSIVADNMGRGGKHRTAKVPRIFYPGRWSSDTSYANRLDFDDGEYVANTLTVVGQEWVETPLGRYLSWKSEITSRSVVMGLIKGIDWWTPELGAPVRFATSCGTPDGSRMDFVAILTRSSIVSA